MKHGGMPEAGHCPGRPHPAHSYAPICCAGNQPEAWKHASPLTVQNLLMRVGLYSIFEDFHFILLMSLTYRTCPQHCYPPSSMAPAHDNAATRGGRGAGPSGTAPRMPADPIMDMSIYMISSNYGLAAHVRYWNGCALLQLCAQCQDHNGS